MSPFKVLLTSNDFIIIYRLHKYSSASITEHLICLVIEGNQICLDNQTKRLVIHAASQCMFGYRGIRLSKQPICHFYNQMFGYRGTTVLDFRSIECHSTNVFAC